MTLPNFVTFFRILLIPLFVIFLFSPLGSHGRYFAVLLFILLALGDALDGYLARRLKQISDLGKYLDPLADKLLVFAAYLGLIEIGVVSSIPVMIILAREFAVMGIRISAASKGNVVAATVLSKWKTAMQILAAVMLMLSLPYSVWVLWLAVFITLVSGLEYTKYGRK